MSEISKTIENIEKIGNDLYKYNLVRTTTFQTHIETLTKEKTRLEAEIANIDYLLAEIAKLS